jgi:uncharacterized protein YraI
MKCFARNQWGGTMKKFLIISVLACLLTTVVQPQTAVVSRDSNLRSGPSSSSKLVGALPAGTAVTVISKYSRSGYLKVKTTDERQSGWVLKRNIAEAELNAVRAQPHRSGSRVGEDQIYPISDLTPGKEDPGVTQDNIAKNICKKGWSTESVRPPVSVTNNIKRDTMEAYGFKDAANHYELDHLISLQNGGCPACVENLFPEAYGDRDHPMTQNKRAAWNRKHPGSTEVFPGALEKDLAENHVHDEICFGIPNAKMSAYGKKYPPKVPITLKRGQEILATDWYACYLNMMDGNKPCE